ncbi:MULTISPECIES: LysR family transcriptional regulator [unclassified Sulfitobacter]|uniref:LysR family transcriptional regulator n=1 Tax=unclassified Sulfitobacter TaxID=196795 RepID=UPI0007C3F1F6|nr:MULTISPECIES: LysR family transcriptional regulator [unclassified Sulfitobacter]KZX97382.1 LysR family transcriptional regulator [Sulfitobacter sp. HI0023]KZY23223.1 LysR family transcriptional regulator [Sulfitobacter sp. HI0040]
MIKSQITLKQLEAFAFVVDTGTFRAAATALGTTQPNISSRISALEMALDVALLYRDAGSVRLTEKGRELLVLTRDILRAGEALLEAAGRQELIEERLRLGVTELVACTWLQSFLRLLRQEYPNLRVELEVDLSRQIDERLREGRLDLALQNGPFAFQATGEQALSEEPYVWVANADLANELAGGTSVARFFDKAVLTHARHTSAARALHELAAKGGYDAGKIIHSSALSACLPMVNEGLGVALLPRSLVSEEIKDGRLQSLKSDWIAPPLSFFARFNTDRAPRFVAKACEIAASVRPAET